MKLGRPFAQSLRLFKAGAAAQSRIPSGNISIGFKFEANQCHHPALPLMRAVAFHIASNFKNKVNERLHDHGSCARRDGACLDSHGHGPSDSIRLGNARCITQADNCSTDTSRRDRTGQIAKLVVRVRDDTKHHDDDSDQFPPRNKHGVCLGRREFYVPISGYPGQGHRREQHPDDAGNLQGHVERYYGPLIFALGHNAG